ncbi:hypothetical protein EC957_006770 [Mortierella hygrophila]|uniref:Uncharacterized protein n=1 Tax=Mortierella hygrophila TaxID=979708 RepID=A0A9P6EYV7_9FUNG|nr:hypothetical protein EC957_006770 [Mortierella hygrophila]
MTYITDLPEEILEHIGLALADSASIVPLILVSRWAHHHFQHLVWRRITITPTTPSALIPTLKDHAHLVFSLRFQDTVLKGFYQIAFPRLTFFQLYNSDCYIKGRAMCFDLADLFRLNPSIQDITINAKRLFLNKYFWDVIHTSLHNPRRLYLARSSSEGSTEPVFWEAWRRFEEIEYTRRFDSCTGWFGDAVDGSVRLKSFKCDGKRYFPAHTTGLWRWLRKCPNLTTPHWPYIRVDLEMFTMGEFNKPVWPHVEDLSLEEMGRCDDEAARLFFGHLGPLKHLRMTRGFLGPHFFDLLRERHFDSLRTLCVENMSSITGEMVLGVLQHCAPLEVFETRRMSLLDFRANPGPWACLGLRRLRVAVETDPMDQEVDRMFFEQLSKLTNLEDFDISRSPHDAWKGPQQHLLQLRLDRGLAQLSTLTRLWTVKIESTGQELSSEDVEWMLEHWPLLARLSGKLSSDADIEERLIGLLVDRRVVCEQYTHLVESLYEHLNGLFSDRS